MSILGILFLSYLGVSLFLYFRQTRFIFFPSPYVETTPDAFNLNYQDVWIPVRAGDRTVQLHGWWIPAQQERGVVLYLHGNGSNIGANVAQAARFHELNLSVLLIDYRGYGQSGGGFPNEASVYQDAEAAWSYLVGQQGISPKKIVLYGHSLGGAIAINLALQHPEAAGLIVQSSFTSIENMTYRTTPYRFLPISLILTQRFDSISKVRSLKMPVLFIHGTADLNVPSDMSESLYNAAPQPKQLWIVPDAGHNNVADIAGADYLSVVKAFVEQLNLAGSSRSVATAEQEIW